MDLGTKTQPRALYASEMASADLAKRLNEAKEGLSAAIEQADGEAILTFREEIKRLPVLIETAQITELRTRQRELEAELVQNDNAAKLLNQALTVARLELEEAMKAVEPFQEKYLRVHLEKDLVRNKRELLLGEGRSVRVKLHGLTEKMKG